jgi:hypothetical protein
MKRTLRVFVYRNLNEQTFSVRDVKTGRVICHAERLLLRNAVFKVSAAGRLRVLREQRKNVHAGIEGELCLDPAVDCSRFTAEVKYDPYQADHFYLVASGQYVRRTDVVLLSGGKAWI